MKIIKTITLLVVVTIGLQSCVFAGAGEKGIEEKDAAINTIYPDIGHKGQILTVTISGQNSHFTQGTNMIWFKQGTSTIQAYDIVPENDTLINATFNLTLDPEEGYYDVDGYNNYDGNLDALVDGFLLKGPASLTGVSPSEGVVGTEVSLTINGENTSFENATDLIAALIHDSDTLYLNANVVDELTLVASVLIPYTAITGFYNLYVNNEYDGDLFLYDGFYVGTNPVYPEISSVSPDSILVDNVSQVTINCLNTHLNPNNNTEVWLTKDTLTINDTAVTINSTVQLVATFDANSAELGLWDVNISNDDDGHIILPQGIKIYKISGIEDVFEVADLSVYPNPCFDILNVSGNFPQNENISVRIIDANGKELIRKKESSENLNSYSLNISGLIDGVYIIQFSNNKGVISEKILKVSN